MYSMKIGMFLFIWWLTVVLILTLRELVILLVCKEKLHPNEVQTFVLNI